jgi:hypothetical protein
MATTAWDIATEKRSHPGSHRANKSEIAIISDVPLVPESVRPGAKFGGFGFGKQGLGPGQGERGIKISRPMESLPSMLFVACFGLKADE